MRNENASALRTAADRIMAVRTSWEGVGLFVIENLETGAVGMTLVPTDAPRPNWSQALIDREPGWDRYEDLQLVPVLQRWGAAAGSARWGELANLLALHVPRSLVTAMPPAGRRLAAAPGMAVHALPPDAGADPILGRLVAWLLPWERIAVDDQRHACAPWAPRRGVSWTWTAEALHGAGGRTRDERLAAGGMIQWGVLAAWPSVIDAVTAFLLAQAAALEATPPVEGAPAALAPASARRQRRGGPLSKDRRAVVLVAVHEALTGKTDKARPGQSRQFAAYEWALCSKALNVSAALAGIRLDWCPDWYMERLRQERGTELTVADLLGTVKTARAFANSVREGMTEQQRMWVVGVGKVQHGTT
jgi:hypothetical protein